MHEYNIHSMDFEDYLEDKRSGGRRRHRRRVVCNIFKTQVGGPDHGITIPKHFFLQLSHDAKKIWKQLGGKDRQLIHDSIKEKINNDAAVITSNKNKLVQTPSDCTPPRKNSEAKIVRFITRNKSTEIESEKEEETDKEDADSTRSICQLCGLLSTR